MHVLGWRDNPREGKKAREMIELQKTKTVSNKKDPLVISSSSSFEQYVSM